MGNGGQHGIAVGAAASLCTEHGTTPRGVYEHHLDDLQELTGRLTGCPHLHVPPAEEPVVLTVREAAERHAANVQSMDIEALMADFVGNTFMNLMAGGSMPPMPTTRWEILSETPDGDAVELHVRYANDTDALELRTRWQQIGPDWKITKATKVEG